MLIVDVFFMRISIGFCLKQSVISVFLTLAQSLWSWGQWSPCRWRQTAPPQEDTWCRTPRTHGPEPGGPSGEGQTWCCWVSPATPHWPRPECKSTWKERGWTCEEWINKRNSLACLSNNKIDPLPHDKQLEPKSTLDHKCVKSSTNYQLPALTTSLLSFLAWEWISSSSITWIRDFCVSESRSFARTHTRHSLMQDVQRAGWRYSCSELNWPNIHPIWPASLRVSVLHGQMY